METKRLSELLGIFEGRVPVTDSASLSELAFLARNALVNCPPQFAFLGCCIKQVLTSADLRPIRFLHPLIPSTVTTLGRLVYALASDLPTGGECTEHERHFASPDVIEACSIAASSDPSFGDSLAVARCALLHGSAAVIEACRQINAAYLNASDPNKPSSLNDLAVPLEETARLISSGVQILVEYCPVPVRVIGSERCHCGDGSVCMAGCYGTCPDCNGSPEYEVVEVLGHASLKVRPLPATTISSLQSQPARRTQRMVTVVQERRRVGGGRLRGQLGTGLFRRGRRGSAP